MIWDTVCDVDIVLNQNVADLNGSMQAITMYAINIGKKALNTPIKTVRSLIIL